MNAHPGPARVLPDPGATGRELQPAIAVLLGTPAQRTLRALWEAEPTIRAVFSVQSRAEGAAPEIPEWRIADTIWTDRGIFPSGERYALWVMCEL